MRAKLNVKEPTLQARVTLTPAEPGATVVGMGRTIQHHNTNAFEWVSGNEGRGSTPEATCDCGEQKQRQRADDEQARQIDQVLRVQHQIEKNVASGRWASSTSGLGGMANA